MVAPGLLLFKGSILTAWLSKMNSGDSRQNQFARRRIDDARLALSLRRQGVTDFATANVTDFEGFGFTRVWNPLEASL